MPKKNIHGRCRLCNSDEWLVDSDIISKFLYKPLKETDGRFYIVSTDPSVKVITKQKTIAEYLLCAQCDNVRLSQYEGHLAQVLLRARSLTAKEVGPLSVVTGHDYKKIKNGLLSLLWRMSLSTDPFFAAVDLGAQHEERLRGVLLNDIKLSEREYPILVVAPYLDGGISRNSIVMPTFARRDGNRIYRCLISGFIFTFIVGSVPLGDEELARMLCSTSWPIWRIKAEDIEFLHGHFLEQKEAKIARERHD